MIGRILLRTGKSARPLAAPLRKQREPITMRRMRACSTAGAICAGLTLCAALFVACSSGSTPTEVPAQGAPTSPPPASPATTSEATASPPPTSATETPAGQAAPAPAKPKKAPESVADCKEMLSEITNDPPSGGVVMNNAMTAKDAGSSDRLHPILEVVQSKRDSFRCCFDVYARKNPGAKGRVAFTLKLDPEGKLVESKIKQDESDITAPEVESCMTELSQTITWPKSPSGKDTVYTHRFEFKPRR